MSSKSRTSATRSLVLFALMLAIVPFAPYLGFWLRLQWNDLVAENASAPRKPKPLRLIHSHGSRSEHGDAPRDTFETSLAPKLAQPKPATPAKHKLTEEEIEQAIARKEERLAIWTVNHNEEWDELDSELQDCSAWNYTHGWSWTPESAIETCLTFFEMEDGD